jgi:hypothetical protein
MKTLEFMIAYIGGLITGAIIQIVIRRIYEKGK